MSIMAVPLAGVKATLKRLAVNPELSWQVFKELDCSSCSAAAGRRKAAAEARSSNGVLGENHILKRCEATERGETWRQPRGRERERKPVGRELSALDLRLVRSNRVPAVE